MGIMVTDVPLSTIPDDEFRALLDAAARGRLDEQTLDQLKSAEVVERTYLCLVSMKKSVEGQLAAKRADYIKARSKLRGKPTELAAEAEKYQTWRAGALRFKSGVEEFMMAVRGNREKAPEVHDYYLPYQTLKLAIIQHREHVCDDECDVECAADTRLWSVLEDIT